MPISARSCNGSVHGVCGSRGLTIDSASTSVRRSVISPWRARSTVIFRSISRRSFVRSLASVVRRAKSCANCSNAFAILGYTGLVNGDIEVLWVHVSQWRSVRASVRRAFRVCDVESSREHTKHETPLMKVTFVKPFAKHFLRLGSNQPSPRVLSKAGSISTWNPSFAERHLLIYDSPMAT